MAPKCGGPEGKRSRAARKDATGHFRLPQAQEVRKKEGAKAVSPGRKGTSVQKDGSFKERLDKSKRRQGHREFKNIQKTQPL